MLAQNNQKSRNIVLKRVEFRFSATKLPYLEIFADS
jgi:hypothetical protein